MKIYLRKGSVIEVEERLTEALVNSFNNYAGRLSHADELIMVRDNGKLVLAINRKEILYIQ